jgi:acyl-CoA-binding protein
MAMRRDWNLVKRFVWRGWLGLFGLSLPGALALVVAGGLLLVVQIMLGMLSWVVAVGYVSAVYPFFFFVAFCIGSLAAGNLIYLAMDLEGEKAKELEKRGALFEREAWRSALADMLGEMDEADRLKWEAWLKTRLQSPPR